MYKILLLLKNEKERNSLSIFLSKDYQPLSSETVFPVDKSFDLCILDGTHLRRFRTQVSERKKAGEDFLPFLLVNFPGDAVLDLPDLSEIIDDTISAPISETELLLRVRNLLERRKLSLQLAPAQTDQGAGPADVVHQEDDFFKIVFDYSPDAIFIHPWKEKGFGKFLHVNRVACERYGYSREEFLNLSAVDISDVADARSKGAAKIRKILAEKGHLIFEAKHFSKDGRKFPVEINARIFQYGGKKTEVSIVRDISDWKKAEAALRESEERYRFITKVISDYAYSFRVQKNGKMKREWISEKFFRVFGFTTEEIDARSGWQALVYPDDLPIAMEHATRVISGDEDVCEMRFVTRQGEPRWLRDYAVPVWDEKLKRVIRIYGAAQDITERRQIENAVKESEANIRSLINARNESIWSVDHNFCYLVFNDFFSDAYKAIYGVTLEKGMSALDILSPKQRRFWKSKYRKALAGEQQTFEYQEELPDGVHVFEVLLNPIRVGKTIVGVSAISIDITERKAINEKLRESEERFRLAFHTNPDSINLNRLEDGMYVDINEGFTEITGFTREDVIGKTSLEINIWADPRDRKRLVKALKKRGRVTNLEAKFRMKDGRVATGLMSACVIKLNDVAHLISITRNIEELKQLEKERENLFAETEQARKLLSDVFERITDGVVALDKNWRFTYVNSKAAILLNRKKPEDLLGKHIWTEYPEGIELPFYRAYYKAMKTQQTIYLEDYYEPWNRWFENRIYPSPDGLTIYFTEVTDRKLSEIALQQSEGKYRILFENSPVPLWEEDYSDVIEYLDKLFASGVKKAELAEHLTAHPEVLLECARRVRVVSVNQAAVRLHDAKDKQDLLGNLDKILGESSYAAFKDELIALARGGKRFSAESQVKTVNGELKDIYLNYVALAEEFAFFPKNDSLVLIATLDITPLKNAQRALERSLLELDQLYNLSLRVRQIQQSQKMAVEVLHVIKPSVEPDIALFYFKEGEQLKLFASEFREMEFDLDAARIHHVNECLCGLAAATGKSVFSKNIFTDNRCTRDECKMAGIRSFAGLPLLAGDEVIGIIGLGSLHERDFSRQRAFLETLANEAAVGLQNTLLLERLRRHEADLEKEVAERTAELMEANQELESFSYSVSHDLRSPLRAIDGFSGMIVEKFADKMDAEAQRLIGIVRKNVQRMSELIDDLLALSRIGRHALKPQEIDMAELARSAFAGLTDVEQRGKIRFKVKTLPQTQGDASLMQQVMTNLLSNAIKFSSGKNNPQIEVGSRTENDTTVYYVSDNGVGFDMKYADKLFLVFQRLHSAEEFEGTGIGLSIVHRIISRHGGRIWAESKPNEGAVFYFTLSENPSKKNN
ncbi:MAG: PAS domain S-box protein [Calditrichaeota bacterium]|nr:PAS domain S-box protein [Calditrichota bacterium]